jgi:hypothetical protein
LGADEGSGFASFGFSAGAFASAYVVVVASYVVFAVDLGV